MKSGKTPSWAWVVYLAGLVSVVTVLGVALALGAGSGPVVIVGIALFGFAGAVLMNQKRGSR